MTFEIYTLCRIITELNERFFTKILNDERLVSRVKDPMQMCERHKEPFALINNNRESAAKPPLKELLECFLCL